MKKFIAKRVTYSVIVLWAVVTAVFLGLRAIPGNPAQAMLGPEASASAVEALEQSMNLDEPIFTQYIDWLSNILVGDFGTGIRSGEDVFTLVIHQAAPKTLGISMVALGVGFLLAIPTGVISAIRKNEPIDRVATIGAFMGLSMPAFFIGILLAIIFGVRLGFFPLIGITPISEGIIPWFRSLILPGVAVGLPYAAIVMRMLRSSLLEVLNNPYMQTAHAKGLNRHVQLYKHALQNAMIPVVTIAGIQIALILVGSVTVELVFSINGLGRLLVRGMLQRNYPLVQGVILLVASIMIFSNLVVDILYTILDPRVKYDE